jgi:undecaprenyl phosphate-alpha-L-ara4FN deformylase
VFLPLTSDAGDEVGQPQVPATLPTYDEVVGRGGATADDYFSGLAPRLAPERLNVLTIHAEVEGIREAVAFDRFVATTAADGAAFVPLGELVRRAADARACRIDEVSIPGREGWVAAQREDAA